MALVKAIRKRCEYCRDYDIITCWCSLHQKAVLWYEVCDQWQHHRVSGPLIARNEMRGAIARGKEKKNG